MEVHDSADDGASVATDSRVAAARSASLGAKIYWWLLHAAALATLLTHSSDFWNGILKSELWVSIYLCCFAVLCVLFTGFSFKSPGWVKPHDPDMHVDLPLASPLPEQTTSEQNGDHDAAPLRGVVDDINGVERFYCERSQMYLPLRARYCREVGRPVRRFDHFCFWVGNVVGEKNHNLFWWFLLFQTVVLWWTMIILSDSFSGSTSDDDWIVRNGAVLLIFIICICMCMIPTVLLGYHTYLIVTNQTTWEHMKREDISYLRDYPEHIYPFSRGARWNVSQFCCPPCKPASSRPDIHILAKEPYTEATTCAFCDNEYYSCF